MAILTFSLIRLCGFAGLTESSPFKYANLYLRLDTCSARMRHYHRYLLTYSVMQRGTGTRKY